MEDPESAADFDMLASSLIADTSDVKILLKALVTRLSGALGERLEVERAGGLLRKSQDIKSIAVDLGDERLEATANGGRLTCSVARWSGGIRIRSEKVSTDIWINTLLKALQTEAQSSEATRQALEEMMIGGNT